MRCKLYADRSALRLLVVANLLSPLAGCNTSSTSRQVNEAKAYSISLPLASYARSQTSHLATAERTSEIHFPTLLVFGADGGEFYESHEGLANSKILSGKLSAIQSSRAIREGDAFGAFIRSVPELKSSISGLESPRRITVVSVDLEDCRACSVQDKALQRVESDLLSQSINVVELHVAKP